MNLGSQGGASFSLRILGGGQWWQPHVCSKGLGESKEDIAAELQETLPVLGRSDKENFDLQDRKLLNFSRTWLLQRTGQDMPGAFC